MLVKKKRISVIVLIELVLWKCTIYYAEFII